MKKVLVILFVLLSNISFADVRDGQLISDAEIETTLKNFMAPLVKAALLNPENIKIHIIADSSLNAFVTNGTDMFINSGLIIKFADDPNVLYGVMAHEIAHIYAGHLTRMRNDYENMSKIAIGGTILGLASVLAGAPEAGTAISMGSLQTAQSGLFSYSREHETEADKIAVDLLYKTHNNGTGLIKFFEYVGQRDIYAAGNVYNRTHPLNNDRIASIQNSIKAKLGKFGDNINETTRETFKRIAIKLDAFLSPPGEVIAKYKNNKYGLSIGYFRSGKLKAASELLDQVIATHSNNPYLWELKGQYYYENGIFDKAIQYYQTSLKFAPKDNLIKIELASAKINQAKGPKDQELLKSATKLLTQVIILQPENTIAYFMLSRAYGILGDQMRAVSALADYYFYQGLYMKSQILANKVLKMAPPTSKEYLRASDIVEFTKDALKNDQGR
jgi:predicted Zn-dependent protease